MYLCKSNYKLFIAYQKAKNVSMNTECTKIQGFEILECKICKNTITFNNNPLMIAYIFKDGYYNKN